jgi:hypothetical protein
MKIVGFYKQLKICFSCAAAALILISGFSCSTTSLTAAWKDQNYKGGALKKIVVIALYKNLTNRENVENEIVNILTKAKIDAVPSLNIMAPNKKYKYEEMEKIFDGLKIDGILILKLKSIQKKEKVIPGSMHEIPNPLYNPYYNYYDLTYRTMYEPSYISETDTVFIESKLYTGDTDRLVWMAEMKLIENYSTQDGLTNPRKEGAEMGKLILNALGNGGLINLKK